MKNHLGQWSKDGTCARVECGKQGHGKSTSPDNLIANRDAFFFLSAMGEETCAFCLKKAITKTPKRYARVAAMQASGATLDEVIAETTRLQAEKKAVTV
jgi:hypothetical protein